MKQNWINISENIVASMGLNVIRDLRLARKVGLAKNNLCSVETKFQAYTLIIKAEESSYLGCASMGF